MWYPRFTRGFVWVTICAFSAANAHQAWPELDDPSRPHDGHGRPLAYSSPCPEGGAYYEGPETPKTPITSELETPPSSIVYSQSPLDTVSPPPSPSYTEPSEASYSSAHLTPPLSLEPPEGNPTSLLPPSSSQGPPSLSSAEPPGFGDSSSPPQPGPSDGISGPTFPPGTRLSLADALVAAGCSKFLAFLQSDPDAWALYTSGKVKTVFAPSNPYFDGKGYYVRRDDGDNGGGGNDTEKLYYQASNAITKMSRQPDDDYVIETFDPNANLNGSNMTVVTESTQNGTDKVKRDAAGIKIASGLGDLVDVITPDFPFDSGVIQVTNGLFTLPELFSQTFQVLSVGTGFDALASQANLTSMIDNTPSVTLFVPSNAALAAAGLSNATSSTTQSGYELPTASVLNHVVRGIDFAGNVGYLPNLENGLVMKTLSGTTLTVTVKGKNYYINDALITKSNVILPNGVAHVVDKVITERYGGVPVQGSNAPLQGARISIQTILTLFISVLFVLSFFH